MIDSDAINREMADKMSRSPRASLRPRRSGELALPNFDTAAVATGRDQRQIGTRGNMAHSAVARFENEEALAIAG